VDINRAIEILKTAILMERQGKAFYSVVASQTQSNAVKDVFTLMAAEEDGHIDFLTRQFKHFAQRHEFLCKDELGLPAAVDREILTQEVCNQITAASYEAAAISAAIDMENRSVMVYTERARETTDTHEKELYEFLANWEKGHTRILTDMNEQLLEEVWNDNQFWPF